MVTFSPKVRQCRVWCCIVHFYRSLLLSRNCALIVSSQLTFAVAIQNRHPLIAMPFRMISENECSVSIDNRERDPMNWIASNRASNRLSPNKTIEVSPASRVETSSQVELRVEKKIFVCSNLYLYTNYKTIQGTAPRHTLHQR